MKTILVVDSNSIFNRAFYGIKLLSTKEGKFTNAIYGFLVTLEKLKSQFSPDAVICAFDLPQKTFRNAIYEEYKQHRHGMPGEMSSQLPDLQNLIQYMGYSIVTCEGYEADDILGTIARICTEDGNYNCVLATGDRDILQLVSKNVNVNMALTRMQKSETISYDELKIKEEYGILPWQLVEVKALQGDTSDNIPGVRGIGQKTALKLIQEYGNIDNIYNNIDTLPIKESVRKKLLDGKESAYMSRDLGKIFTDVPIDKDIEHYFPKPMDVDNVKRLMKELEFFSLIKKMNFPQESIKNDNQLIKNNKIHVDVNADCTQILENIKKQKKVCFMYYACENVLDGLCLLVNEEIYIVKRSNSDFLNFIVGLFKIPDVCKVTYDSKTLYYLFLKMGIEVLTVDFDILLASYILNPSLSDYSIDKMIQQYDIEYPNIETENNIIIDEKILSTSVLLVLSEKLKDELIQKNQTYLLKKIEQPLSVVLSDMENVGFELDVRGLKKYSEILQNKIIETQDKIYNLVGIEFNINSPKQLSHIIFEKLKLNHGKKNKRGYSTNAEVLESLKDLHPAINCILEYRMLSKLKSTYCDGMIKLVKEDSRIHSIFNQTETRTGRISSLEPNLQNIPIRTPLGRNLRKYFRAKTGHMLVDADYSQIELRVLAHLSKDKNMMEAFERGLDVHSITAEKIFSVSASEVDIQKRNFAKTINFGVIYGMSAFSLSKDLNITKWEASQYIDNYFNYYSGIREYMHETIENARKNGYVKTIFDRIRYLPELQSSNYNIRSFGERIARNMPIQGSAADIIKIAMINVYRRIKQEGMSSNLILQVHDELILEVPEGETFMAQKFLIDEMENAVRLDVPLVVNSAIGKNWYDAKC